MTKQRSKSLTNLKMLMIMPVIALVMLAFSTCSEQEQSSKGQTGIMKEPPPPPPPPPVSGSGDIIAERALRGEEDSEPFVVVEEMPVFPGGETALLNYLGENTQEDFNLVILYGSVSNGSIIGRVYSRIATFSLTVDFLTKPRMNARFSAVVPSSNNATKSPM